MINVDIKIEGLNTIKSAWAKRPDLVKRYMNQAIENSVAEIDKNAVDENFQFKTPRSQRTGYLARSFYFGIVTKDLYGAIGPTVDYANKVHQNNQFMPRIARVSQPAIERHFRENLKFLAEELSKK